MTRATRRQTPQPSLFDAQLYDDVERLRGWNATLQELAAERLSTIQIMENDTARLRQDRDTLIARCNTLEAENTALTTLLRLGTRQPPAAAAPDLVRALT